MPRGEVNQTLWTPTHLVIIQYLHGFSSHPGVLCIAWGVYLIVATAWNKSNWGIPPPTNMLTDFIKMLYRINFISIWEIQRTHGPFPRLSSGGFLTLSRHVFILSVFIASVCPLLQQGVGLCSFLLKS